VTTAAANAADQSVFERTGNQFAKDNASHRTPVLISSEPGLLGLLVAYPGEGVYEFAPRGHVAEWLRNGLQNRVHQFNSGRGLHLIPLIFQSYFIHRPPRRPGLLPHYSACGLFAGAGRAMRPSAEGFTDQGVNARHFDLIWIVLDRRWQYWCSNLVNFGDHLDGIWSPLAHIEDQGRGAVIGRSR
jgi:hypothetical protein